MTVARQEADREDLFAEARGLRPRARWTDGAAEIVAGLRAAGRFTIYLGPDLMLDFDAADRWRRAYDHGWLCRADAGDMVRARRVRTPETTELRAARLPDAAAAELLDAWRKRCAAAWREQAEGVDWRLDAAAGMGDPAEGAAAVAERWARLAALPVWRIAPDAAAPRG